MPKLDLTTKLNPVTGMKICIHCRESKPGEAFYRDGRRTDKLHPMCRICRAAYLSEYSAQVRSETRVCTECGESKPGDNFRKLRNKCRSCESVYTSKWNKANPELAKIAADKWHENNHSHLMLLDCRRRANKKSIPCTLTDEDIHIPERCPICSCFLVRGGENRDFSPSMDAWNPKLGYTRENAWVICLGCNRRKNDIPGDELIAFAFRVVTAFKEHCGRLA